MELGVEILSRALDRLDAVGFEEFDELVVDQLHAFLDRFGVVGVLVCLYAALEVVDDRKQAAKNFFGGILDYVALFLDCAFAEVVELCQKKQIFFLLFLEGGIGFVEFLVELVYFIGFGLDFLFLFCGYSFVGHFDDVVFDAYAFAGVFRLGDVGMFFIVLAHSLLSVVEMLRLSVTAKTVPKRASVCSAMIR